jgi:hypothetical protein
VNKKTKNKKEKSAEVSSLFFIAHNKMTYVVSSSPPESPKLTVASRPLKVHLTS